IPPAYLVTCPELPTLKVLISAGEAISPTIANRFTGTCRLFNAYGPSENAVCTTFYEVGSIDGQIPIGKPIQNVQVKVVNENGQLVPIGVEGELHIAGLGLSRGYTDAAL